MAQKQSEENITLYLQEQINALSQDIQVVQIPNKRKDLQSLKNECIPTCGNCFRGIGSMHCT